MIVSVLEISAQNDSTNQKQKPEETKLTWRDVVTNVNNIFLNQSDLNIIYT